MSASAVTLTAGGSKQTVTLTATAGNGFSGAVQVTAAGLPGGVSIAPSALKLMPGTPQAVTLAAAGTAAAGTAQAQFNAVSGAIRQITPITVTVSIVQGQDVVTYNTTTLKEIYNSSQAANGRDKFGNGNKFITPSGVAEFGLLQ